MQPRDTGTGGAEPDRFGPDSLPHRLANGPPEGTSLPYRRVSDERGQMPISRRSGDRARHHHDRIAAKVGKHQHFLDLGTAEVFGESLWVRPPRQTGAIQEDELEGLS